MTLKIRSSSPRSNLLFPSSQQRIYARLVNIHSLIHKKRKETLFLTFQSALETLKIRSMTLKFNLLFPSSKQCVNESLVKIHPLVQKVMHRNPILDISKCSNDLLKIRSGSPKFDVISPSSNNVSMRMCLKSSH